jgi:hypothetical protein
LKKAVPAEPKAPVATGTFRDDTYFRL